MRSITCNSTSVKSLQAMWVLLCMCFMLASSAVPAYSAHKILPNMAVHKSILDDDTKNPDASHHGTELSHRAMTHQYHADIGSNLPCDDPQCNFSSDCNDSCAMTTCCSFPHAFNVSSNGVFSNYRGATHLQLSDKSAVISRRSEPLFRPPIQ